MSDVQIFTVMGEPRGKQRAKTYRHGNFTKTVTPEQTVVYENLIALEYRRQCMDFRFKDNAMLAIVIKAYFSIPKSASKKNRALMIERDDFERLFYFMTDQLHNRIGELKALMES